MFAIGEAKERLEKGFKEAASNAKVAEIVHDKGLTVDLAEHA